MHGGDMKKGNAMMWTVQGVLAALFLFAGVMKLVMPLEAMTAEMPFLPGWFLRCIGVAETLGAIGLVLPWLLRIHSELTPIAAVGLLIIMAGAVTLTLPAGFAAAVMPLVVGSLCALVAYYRSRALQLSH